MLGRDCRRARCCAAQHVGLRHKHLSVLSALIFHTSFLNHAVTCYAMTLWIPPNVDGEKRCLIQGDGSVGGESDSPSTFYAVNSWDDIEFYTPTKYNDYAGTMFCTADFSESCAILDLNGNSGAWECTDSNSICQNPPTPAPSRNPSTSPTPAPTSNPTAYPSIDPTTTPTPAPTSTPTSDPSAGPSITPSLSPTIEGASVAADDIIPTTRPSAATEEDDEAISAENQDSFMNSPIFLMMIGFSCVALLCFLVLWILKLRRKEADKTGDFREERKSIQLANVQSVSALSHRDDVDDSQEDGNREMYDVMPQTPNDSLASELQLRANVFPTPTGDRAVVAPSLHSAAEEAASMEGVTDAPGRRSESAHFETATSSPKGGDDV